MDSHVFGTREDAAITDLETAGSSPDNHTAMGLLKGMVHILASVQDALDIITSKLDSVSVESTSYSDNVVFTPAAASHTAGDVNGAIGEFTVMGPSGGGIMITSASLLIVGATAEATAWRLYLSNVTWPSALADDAAFVLAAADLPGFLGYVDLGTAVDLVDNQWVETHGINKQLKLAGTSLFAYLVNLTTLTPAAVAHTVTLHAIAL